MSARTPRVKMAQHVKMVIIHIHVSVLMDLREKTA